MYSKIQFGYELKQKISEKKHLPEIGAWAYEIFLNYSNCFDDDFLNLLITLNTMELGPEFAFTYEELHQIADTLISGKDVNI